MCINTLSNIFGYNYLYMELLSDEYIRGLVEGEGCFTFDTRVKREEKLKQLLVISILNEMKSFEAHENINEAAKNKQ